MLRVLFNPLILAILFIGTNELRVVLAQALLMSEELTALLIFFITDTP